MSYRVVVGPLVRRNITSWQLSDPIWVTVYLRLEDLGQSPSKLRRETAPFDGMTYRFSLIDPTNRLVEHFFVFAVFYSQDEESLIVARGAYVRSAGL